MAKPATLQIRLVSTADTGYFYVTKKNPRTKPEKLEVRKYDPKARKHVCSAKPRSSSVPPRRIIRQAPGHMISLAFHHDRIVAATVSDGGDFVMTSDCHARR